VVDVLRRLAEPVVHGHDLARQRREHVGDGLHGLDLRVHLVLRDLRAHLGRVEEDDLSERVLGVPRDAEGGLVALDAGPVVLGVVLQVVGIGRCH
jgi:hypothetical protein